MGDKAWGRGCGDRGGEGEPKKKRGEWASRPNVVEVRIAKKKKKKKSNVI